jgi:hypothetical protein
MEDVVHAGLTVASCKNLSPVIHVLNPFVGVSHCADIIAEHLRAGNFAGEKPVTARPRDSGDPARFTRFTWLSGFPPPRE